MSHISWKALNICKEENNYAISWISNECQLFKKYEIKLTFADSLSASFAQLVWRWSPEKMSRVRISVKSNFSSSLWDGARYHERPKFCWGPAMPSIYGQNCGLKTWSLSWHHLHRENAKEFLNDRINASVNEILTSHEVIEPFRIRGFLNLTLLFRLNMFCFVTVS